MKKSDVLKCSINNWYNTFKHVTIKSIFIQLPEGFKEYLLEDGVILPSGEDYLTETYKSETDSNDESDGETVDWDNESDSDTFKQVPVFQDFDSKIKDAIKCLGGKVFPKLNWSSPRDASWIALNNSCCCSSVKDIYLLIKSSDFIVKDIIQPFLFCDESEDLVESIAPGEHSNALPELNHSYRTLQPNNPISLNRSLTVDIPYFLVLRQWTEINPDTEFRCFVKDNSLIGISQRDLTVFSEYNVLHKNYIIEDILNFFMEEIQFNFLLSNYVFDVVRMRRESVILIDFGAFGKRTDPLLFDWDEINSGKITNGQSLMPDYRCPLHNRGIQPNEFSQYALPKDIIDITSGEDSFKFADLLKIVEGQRNESSDDD